MASGSSPSSWDYSVVLPWAALAAAAALEVADRGTTARWAGWPFAVSLVLLGMAHGAADLAVLARVTGRRLRQAALSRAALAYVAAMAGLLVALLVVPRLALIGFLAVTVLHFGRTNAWNTLPRSAPPMAAWAVALGHGLLVLGVPAAAWPDETRAVFNDVLLLLGSAARFTADWAAPGRYVVALGVGFTLIGAALMVKRERTSAGRTVADAAALAMLAVPHPLFSVGVYFLGWHALRDGCRVAARLGRAELPGGRCGWVGLSRLHRASLPLLVPSVAAVVAAAWLWGSGDWARDLALVSLLFFAIATPPHHALVEWLGAHGDETGSGR